MLIKHKVFILKFPQVLSASCSVLSILCDASWLLCSWNSLPKDTVKGSHSLLWGYFQPRGPQNQPLKTSVKKSCFFFLFFFLWLWLVWINWPHNSLFQFLSHISALSSTFLSLMLFPSRYQSWISYHLITEKGKARKRYLTFKSI